jgi:hypothetical protein
MAGPAYTYHPREDETHDVAEARRATDRRRRQERNRQRAQQRGDTPLAQEPDMGMGMSSPDLLPNRMDTPPRRRPHRQGSKISQHYFTCSGCNTHRPIGLLPQNTPVHEVNPYCYICLMAVREGEVETKYCTNCRFSKARLQFMSDTGEKDTCNACLMTSRGVHTAEMPTQSQEEETPVNPAVSEEEWGFIESFYSALSDLHLDECKGCEEKWFDMKLNSAGICKACSNSEKRQKMFTKENHANPPSIPRHLPKLTEHEPMCMCKSDKSRDSSTNMLDTLYVLCKTHKRFTGNFPFFHGTLTLFF